MAPETVTGRPSRAVRTKSIVRSSSSITRMSSRGGSGSAFFEGSTAGLTFSIYEDVLASCEFLPLTAASMICKIFVAA